MGLYKYLSKLWQDNRSQLKEIERERLIKWRKEPSIVTMLRPTRIDKARRLGYKAKQGFAIARIRIRAGGRVRPWVSRGRKPKRFGQRKFAPVRRLQAIAEQRVSTRYPNMEVLNSYLVVEDSKHKWYEVILVDRVHPAIKKDKDVSWVTKKQGRSERGLTSAGRRSRGSRRKKSKYPAKRMAKDRTRRIKRRG